MMINDEFHSEFHMDHWSMNLVKWFQEIVPPVIIYFHGIFDYAATIFGYPHDYGTPYLLTHSLVEYPIY